MSVVNCRVKYIRPRYKDLKDWISDPNNVYIGRGGVLFIDGKRFPEKNSKFANPFILQIRLNKTHLLKGNFSP